MPWLLYNFFIDIHPHGDDPGAGIVFFASIGYRGTGKSIAFMFKMPPVQGDSIRLFNIRLVGFSCAFWASMLKTHRINNRSKQIALPLIIKDLDFCCVELFGNHTLLFVKNVKQKKGGKRAPPFLIADPKHVQSRT